MAVILVGCSPAAPPNAPSAALGHVVEMSLPTDRGALGAVPLRGARVTVVDFFSPTCAPCKEKVPALVAKRETLASAGVALVLVAILADGESTNDARRALAAWGVPGTPFLVDAGDASRREAAVRELPTTLVLDAGGTVRWASPVGATADDVVAAARAAR